VKIKIEIKYIVQAAVVFVTTFFAFIVVVLSGKVFSYNSPEFGNWAMWTGSLFSGVAATGALFAANFTRHTLRFLTRQHGDQLEMQKMQMYLAHKDAFHKLLNQIETSHSNKFIFKSKEALYQSLFPNNDFFTFTATAPLESPNGDTHATLTSINNIYKRLSDSKSNSNYYLRNSHFIGAMKKEFHIQVIDNNSLGNMYCYPPNGKEFRWNVFEIHLLQQFIANATIQFYRFTDNQPPVETKWQNLPQVTMVTEAILEGHNSHGELIPFDKLNLQEDKYRVIPQLAKFVVLLHDDQVGHLINNQIVYARLHTLFESDIDRFKKLLGNLQEQSDLLSDVYHWLEQAINENSSKWAQPLKNDINSQKTQNLSIILKLQEDIARFK